MAALDPAYLLDHPERITPSSPWCVRLDNLELGLVLLTQPWLAGEGLRRADLERRVQRLAGDLPLGPIYFQRVKRAAARLEEIGVLRGLGEGRARRFVLAPEGFAAFLLNLRILDADPTLDGAEFELKRSLVAMWNLVLDRMKDAVEEIQGPPGMEELFAAAEAIRLQGAPVVTDELMAEALDVLRLIATQRDAVERRLAEARRQLAEAGASGSESEIDPRFDPERLAEAGLHEAAVLVAGSPDAAAIVRELSLGVLPRLGRQAAVLRYEQFLVYLDGLAQLHAGVLRRVSIDSLRGLGLKRRS